MGYEHNSACCERDEDGHWKPAGPIHFQGIADPPYSISKILKWLFGWDGYLWPRNVGYVILAFLTWRFMHANLSESASLSPTWIGLMLIRNLALVFLVYSFYHVTLYAWKVMGNECKYHPKGQAKDSRKFLFNDQVKDNIFYTLVSGVPIWTAWEVLYFWLAARGYMPLIRFSSHPVWFVALFFLIPVWRNLHFYCIHRLIHWKPLLRMIHRVHHKNPNPAPWSGMSMHPVEHLMYFSVALLFFVVPSHPMHLLFTVQQAALVPAHTHSGFEGRMFGFWPIGQYFHYLHHKHVACNFGSTLVPLDKWFGRFYDGEGKFILNPNRRE